MTDAFREVGGAASLAGDAATSDVTVSTVGLHNASTFGIGQVRMTCRGDMGWRRAFGATTPVTRTRLLSGGDDPFTIAGVPVARDAAALDFGLDAALSAMIRVGVSYSGQFGNSLLDQAAKATLNVKF